MQKKVELIIKDISLRKNVPYEVAKAIVHSQFKCLRESMKEGEKGKPETFKNINLKYFGKFYTTAKKIEQIHKASNNGNSSEEQTSS